MLRDYADVEESVLPASPFYTHTTAEKLREEFAARGWDWESYVKAAIVRNPWDRFLSAINYIKADHKDLVKKFGGSDHRLFRKILRNWPAQFDYFTVDLGLPIVDQIIQFENIDEGLAAFMSAVGLPEGIKLPHINPSTRGVKSEDVYSDVTIKAVGHKEWRVIDMFDYKFEQNY